MRTSRRLAAELDEIGNEVEKVLYLARLDAVYQDYRIHPVNLKETVLSVIRMEKRHLIQCGNADRSADGSGAGVHG